MTTVESSLYVLYLKRLTRATTTFLLVLGFPRTSSIGHLLCSQNKEMFWTELFTAFLVENTLKSKSSGSWQPDLVD